MSPPCGTSAVPPFDPRRIVVPSRPKSCPQPRAAAIRSLRLPSSPKHQIPVSAQPSNPLIVNQTSSRPVAGVSPAARSFLARRGRSLGSVE